MTHRVHFVSAISVVLAMIAGGGLIAPPRAGAALAPQPVEGLVQVKWFFGVDQTSWSGTYTTSSQLGQGTVTAQFSPINNSQVVFVRSDGMQMTGQASSVTPNIVVNLTGTADIQSATLTLTQLSLTQDPNDPHTGVAEYQLQGLLYAQPLAGHPAAVAITSPTLSGPARSPLGPMTMQLVDQNGAPVPADADTTVNLTSSSPGGAFSLTRCGAPGSFVDFPAGATSEQAYYTDRSAGAPVITASADTLTSATQTENITPPGRRKHIDLPPGRCSPRHQPARWLTYPLTVGISSGFHSAR
jgi:hypothetical protein